MYKQHDVVEFGDIRVFNQVPPPRPETVLKFASVGDSLESLLLAGKAVAYAGSCMVPFGKEWLPKGLVMGLLKPEFSTVEGWIFLTRLESGKSPVPLRRGVCETYYLEDIDGLEDGTTTTFEYSVLHPSIDFLAAIDPKIVDKETTKEEILKVIFYMLPALSSTIRELGLGFEIVGAEKAISREIKEDISEIRFGRKF